MFSIVFAIHVIWSDGRFSSHNTFSLLILYFLSFNSLHVFYQLYNCGVFFGFFFMKLKNRNNLSPLYSCGVFFRFFFFEEQEEAIFAYWGNQRLPSSHIRHRSPKFQFWLPLAIPKLCLEFHLCGLFYIWDIRNFFIPIYINVYHTLLFISYISSHYFKIIIKLNKSFISMIWLKNYLKGCDNKKYYTAFFVNLLVWFGVILYGLSSGEFFIFYFFGLV